MALLFPGFTTLGLGVEDTQAQKEASISSFSRGNLDEGGDNADAGDLRIEIYRAFHRRDPASGMAGPYHQGERHLHRSPHVPAQYATVLPV